MNKIKLFAIVGLFMGVITGVHAAGNQETGAVVAGARLYSGHSAFPGYVYGDGDLSYIIGYEVRNDVAYLQGAVGYAPDITSTNNASGLDTTDYAITPEINLVATELCGGVNVQAGVGLLTTYYADDVAGKKWTDFYWHLILGAGYPLGAVEIRIQAVYAYSAWGDLGDYDANDMEYGAAVAYSF